MNEHIEYRKAFIQMLDAYLETSRQLRHELKTQFWRAERDKQRAFKQLARLRNQHAIEQLAELRQERALQQLAQLRAQRTGRK